MTTVSAATSVSDVTIINPPSYVVDGDQNVELQCTVTLSSTIGPDYSALSIDWRDSTDTIISSCSSPQLHGKTQIVGIVVFSSLATALCSLKKKKKKEERR